jgi:CheY-like chemotaxis protein
MVKPKPKILLVEDDKENANVFVLCLEPEGYDVTWVADGRAAMRQLKQAHFDLVLTDMLMPEADGVELMLFIRGLKQPPDVIPMSGGGVHLTASQALGLAVKMGGRAPLVKPFTMAQLLDAVRSVLGAGANGQAGNQ